MAATQCVNLWLKRGFLTFPGTRTHDLAIKLRMLYPTELIISCEHDAFRFHINHYVCVWGDAFHLIFVTVRLTLRVLPYRIFADHTGRIDSSVTPYL